jgi:hypothetical protein
MVIGIDLGTTNSCVAVIDQHHQQVVIENDGKRTTPSIFSITKEGTRLIGQPAQRQMVVNPRNTFFGVKRLIGRSFTDAETSNFQKQVRNETLSCCLLLRFSLLNLRCRSKWLLRLIAMPGWRLTLARASRLRRSQHRFS